VLVGQTLALAQDPQDAPAAITASDGWIRLPAPGDTGAIACASIANTGMYSAYLLSATTDVAGKVEFRDPRRGPEAIKEVTVLAYKPTTMEPQGLHMYLTDLKRPLKEGETIWLVLETELGIKVDVSAVVKKE
jgi:copper(I)-binding protein